MESTTTPSAAAQATHTPGPWVFDADDNAITPAANADLSICTIDRIDYDPDRLTRFFHGAQTEANARLIASAPALLEAVEALIKQFDEYGIPAEEGSNYPARALMAKAVAARNAARGGAQ